MTMKHSLLACALLWCGLGAAQNPYIAVQGAVQSETGIVEIGRASCRDRV